jgi:hypothetical protein
MDAESGMVEQAARLVAANPAQKVGVYRNIIAAQPWVSESLIMTDIPSPCNQSSVSINLNGNGLVFRAVVWPLVSVGCRQIT